MSTPAASPRAFGSTLRRRWWILPIAVLLVVGAVAVKLLSAPVSVGASVGDGSPTIVRTATIVLHFNQDVDPASVQAGIRISPLTLATVVARDRRTFEIRPWLQPDTPYRLNVSGVRKLMGFGTATYAVAFRTEPAPRVTAVSFNGAPLADGQQAVPLRGKLGVTFSQAMDPKSTSILFDNKALDPKLISWDAAAKIASADLTLAHSRTHSVLVPQTASNQRHDLAIADWKVSFNAMPQVPSAGSTSRIGSGGPIIIQIENSAQPTVRPQTGMQQADMVYEYISEFGIPRLSAVYWHPPTSLIGPVRSCRLITVQLEQMYRGMIYCSGANDYVLGQVWKWPNVVYDYAYMYDFMYRAGDRVAPHNVVARPDQVTAHTAAAGLPALNYDIAPSHPDAALAGATPAASVYIAQHNATWRYDPNSREYLKWQDGAPFGNVGTGQIHAKNLIVEHVTSRLDTSPGNTGVHHDYNTEYYELAGEGAADIYSDGGVIHATWRHPDRNLPVVYYGADGNPIDLNTGLTWVHVIGSDQ
ncbi:MAG: DUF3048 domain-containing protein [Candidatus Dormibacteraeota bacterium]|nr:DUF3048 domain-containing protein [Candidatus Dormibacteraeota bacterium]